MRTPSRRMPPASGPSAPFPWTGWLLLFGLSAGCLWWVVTYPTTLVVMGLCFLLCLAASWCESRRIHRLARSRVGESICTFVRTFEFRTLDTWILRAVYEELHAYYDGRLPIRADDCFEHTLRMDGEELDELGLVVAARAGRSMSSLAANPFYGHVATVEDLVMFLHHQPRTDLHGRNL